MTTAVVSPPSFPSLPRLGWNGGHTSTGGFSAMSSDEPNRMFMPQRKTVTRSSSSSSLSSNSSSTSTGTVTQTETSQSPQTDVANINSLSKKKARGGFWPVSKAESTSVVTNARANGAVQPPISNVVNGSNAKNALQPATGPQNHAVNGARTTNGQNGAMEQTPILALLPMNGTFERKQINVPYYPDILKIGRQTNAKTVPTQVNGFFDSKVLSRAHAEIWAERGSGKIFIRDVKSSNGTFVNGQRLSPEGRESEPHELRQHDTLELGIDIVSEDQKTIVHHKVSAKVEFAGMPGASTNVLDLNFGDLDPSHGGPLMASPMSTPMVQSRSRPGGPASGRSSVASASSGVQMSSVAQQRQANFWGTPLNIEQLVKHLTTEMKAAKQQSQDLDHASSFLNSMIATDGSPSKSHPPLNELSHVRQSSGRVRAVRIDHAARFGDPPAPPPQQPLPEKPDSARSSPVNTTSLDKMLRRSDTAKPPNGLNHSPSGSQNSQILSLVQALEVAKKELDSQSNRVKQLEDLLRQEKSAREAAEQRIKKVEEGISSKPITKIEGKEIESDSAQKSVDIDSLAEQPSISGSNEQILQQKLDHVVAEMQKMKADMDSASQRAVVAEKDATAARASLSEMIERLRQENKAIVTTETSIESASSNKADMSGIVEDAIVHSKQRDGVANGHVRAPSKLPPQLERAMATMMRDSHIQGDITAQSAPYVSMLGVVLIGVGVMAYLNSWQKGDK